MGIVDDPARVPDDATGSARDYQLVVDTAIDRGLVDRESDRVRVHFPLVRRRDQKVAELFRRVVWTTSAWIDLTAMFGDPLDETRPRDPLLEVGLDKAATWLSTLPPVAARSEVAELGFMYEQARLIYTVEPGRVVILAVVPSLTRRQGRTQQETS